MSDDSTMEPRLKPAALELIRKRQVFKLGELLDGVTPENYHDEADWGRAVGKEATPLSIPARGRREVSQQRRIG